MVRRHEAIFSIKLGMPMAQIYPRSSLQESDDPKEGVEGLS